MTRIRLTDRFEQALLYATEIHAAQLRKGTDIPYIAHLLAVTSLVLEDGGDEDQAIAALLHDAPEDQGGLAVLDEIRRRFGDRVAEIVDGCTDTYEHPKPPWRQRKKAYLDHLLLASDEVRRVSLADKLHNARSILYDLRRSGDGTWQRFKGGKQGTLWYYQSLVQVFLKLGGSPLVEELVRTVEEIERLSKQEE